MFFRFSQASNSLTPSSQIVSVNPQSLTPAEKVPEPPVLMDLFNGAIKRAMSSGGHGGSGGHVQPVEPGVPTERTLTGFPKYPKGTKFSSGLVMGEYGPYSPKRRYWQEVVYRNESTYIGALKGARDKPTNMALVAIVVGVAYLFTMTYNCRIDKKYCKFIGVKSK